MTLVCLLVSGTTLHGAAMPMATDHAAMAGDCAGCPMPQGVALACGDLCQVPPAAFPCSTTCSTVTGQLPQPPDRNLLPEGRLGLPELHPPKRSVAAT